MNEYQIIAWVQSTKQKKIDQDPQPSKFFSKRSPTSLVYPLVREVDFISMACKNIEG